MADERVQDALIWLAYALGDLEAARSQSGRRVRPRIVANLAEQAAEKAIKAALVLDGTDPPKSHDLDDLRNRLQSRWRVKRRFPDLARLSRYASESRYPDDIPPVTPIQSATAVRQAVAVVRITREDFGRLGIPTASLDPR
jgi:HEPN domain-containing protein